MLTDAVLLAAGNSTRIAPIGGGIPKPLLSVQGEPVLARNVRWLAGAGVRRIWVNLHYRGDLIRAALGDGAAWGVEIRYSEEPTILGTAGGVRRLLSSLGGGRDVPGRIRGQPCSARPPGLRRVPPCPPRGRFAGAV